MVNEEPAVEDLEVALERAEANHAYYLDLINEIAGALESEGYSDRVKVTIASRLRSGGGSRLLNELEDLRRWVSAADPRNAVDLITQTRLELATLKQTLPTKSEE
jgi:hypothetical protein